MATELVLDPRFPGRVALLRDVGRSGESERVAASSKAATTLGTEGADGDARFCFMSFRSSLNQIPPALLADCRRAFTSSATDEGDESAERLGVSSGETYWQGAGATPLCALEALALEVFHFHVKRLGLEAEKDYMPEESGAEWWTQCIDNRDGEIGFHWDKDYSLEEETGVDVFPHLATVTYLSDKPGGAPTIIFDHAPGAASSIVDQEDGLEVDVSEADVGGGVEAKQVAENAADNTNAAASTRSAPSTSSSSSAPTTSTPLSPVACCEESPYTTTGQASIRRGWLSSPFIGKHICFNGRHLHGAAQSLASAFATRSSPSPSNNATEPLSKRLKRPIGHSTVDEEAESGGLRVTFLVNVWLNWKPLGAERLPNDIAAAMETRHESLGRRGYFSSERTIGGAKRDSSSSSSSSGDGSGGCDEADKGAAAGAATNMAVSFGEPVVDPCPSVIWKGGTCDEGKQRRLVRRFEQRGQRHVLLCPLPDGFPHDDDDSDEESDYDPDDIKNDSSGNKDVEGQLPSGASIAIQWDPLPVEVITEAAGSDESDDDGAVLAFRPTRKGDADCDTEANEDGADNAESFEAEEVFECVD